MSATNLTWVSLAEICSLITDGKHGDCEPDDNSGFYFLSCKDVNNGKLNYRGARQITAVDFHDTHRRTRLEPGDILLTNSGTIGRMAIAPNHELTKRTTFQKSVAILKPLHEEVDSRFLYFALHGELPRLIEFAGGTAQKNLLLRDLRGFRLQLPDLPTQRKIAGILSAYDDLIENNLRRIKILEEMAQSLYREWFVHFRFPGQESARFTESDIGRIPKGWDVKAMTEAVTVRPKVSIPKGGDIPFVTMGGLSENSMLITEVESRDAPTGARFQNGDTLFARITPCLENGKTGYVEFLPSDESAACGSTEFIVLRSKTVCPQYVYLMARSDAFRDNAIKSMSGATGRQRVRDECFDQFFLAQPPDDLLSRFESITRPKFELIHSLNRRNQTLRRTRDLLLSKLLSGGQASFRPGNPAGHRAMSDCHT